MASTMAAPKKVQPMPMTMEKRMISTVLDINAPVKEQGKLQANC